MIKAIKFVSVPVSDQQRALDFYTQTLGFRVITDQPFDDNQRWIELGIGRSSSGISPLAARNPSLPTLRVRVALRHINGRTMVEVRDPKRGIVHESRHAGHILVVDVLRLVRHLVVVEMLAA